MMVALLLALFLGWFAGGGWALVPAPARSVVIGGGPAGLLSAISLKRRGWPNVQVLERLSPPPANDDADAWSDTARFYLLGLNTRGQGPLETFGAWDAILARCVAVRGRKDWAPGAGVDEGVLTLRKNRPPTYVIARDRLVACLLDQCAALGVDVRHGREVSSVDWDAAGHAVIQHRACGSEDCAAAEDDELLTTPLLIACDGARRTVAEAIERDDHNNRTEKSPDVPFFFWRRTEPLFQLRTYEDTNVRVYKTVPFTPSADWRTDLNYGARSAKANFDALPTLGAGGGATTEYCGVLLIKPEDETTRSLADAKAGRAYFDEYLPMFSPLIDDADLAKVVAKPTSKLPTFAYAWPRLHHRASTALLGDAIHSVKPYFGLGANSAFEDVAVFNNALDAETTLEAALRRYSRDRAAEARCLVELSRSFDHTGLRGFAQFIGPIILDGVFHTLLPKVFEPNYLACLQRPGPFTAVRTRKRLDRLGQMTILAASALAASKVVSVALRFVGRRLTAVHLPRALAAAPLAAAALAAAALAKNPPPRTRSPSPTTMDVADLLATTTKPDPDQPQGGGTRPGY